MTFGENLKQFRLDRHFTQEQLAEEFNVTRQTVSKWELNQVMPETGKLVEIAEYFEVSLDEMVFGKKEKETIFSEAKNEKGEEDKDVQDYGILKNVIGIVIITLFFIYGFHSTRHWNLVNLFDISFIVILLVTLGVGIFFKQFREKYLNWAAAASVVTGLIISLCYIKGYMNMNMLQFSWAIAILPFYYGIVIAILLNIKQNHSTVIASYCKKVKRGILQLWKKLI